VACQGYEPLLDSVASGEMSRIRFAHEIWRAMPQSFYSQLGRQIGVELLEQRDRTPSGH
jgi:hypothetical protein